VKTITCVECESSARTRSAAAARRSSKLMRRSSETTCTADRATGYWTTRSDRDPGLNARTAGVYLRADPADLQVLDGESEEERAELIAQRLREWKSVSNVF
jgi:hypothetical protein